MYGKTGVPRRARTNCRDIPLLLNSTDPFMKFRTRRPARSFLAGVILFRIWQFVIVAIHQVVPYLACKRARDFAALRSSFHQVRFTCTWIMRTLKDVKIRDENIPQNLQRRSCTRRLDY